MFYVHTKTLSRRLEKRFQNVRPSSWDKASFSNLPHVVYTKPGLSIKHSKDKWLNIHPQLTYLTFADGIETLCGTLSPFTASSMKRNTKKLPSSPAVNTYLSSKLVLMCCMPPWWLSCTFSAQNELKCSKSFDPSRGWIRRTPSSIPRRRNLPEWLKRPRGQRMLMTIIHFKNYSFLSLYKRRTSMPFHVKKIGILHIYFYLKVLV